jgi:hypothetical protein
MNFKNFQSFGLKAVALAAVVAAGAMSAAVVYFSAGQRKSVDHLALPASV